MRAPGSHSTSAKASSTPPPPPSRRSRSLRGTPAIRLFVAGPRRLDGTGVFWRVRVTDQTARKKAYTSVEVHDGTLPHRCRSAVRVGCINERCPRRRSGKQELHANASHGDGGNTGPSTWKRERRHGISLVHTDRTGCRMAGGAGPD